MSRHYREQDQYKRIILDRFNAILDNGIKSKKSHSDILESLSKYCYSLPQWEKLTGYTSEYIRGYIDRRFSELEREYIEWRVYYNGEYVTGDNVPKGEWDKVELGAMFWKNSNSMYFQSDR